MQRGAAEAAAGPGHVLPDPPQGRGSKRVAKVRPLATIVQSVEVTSSYICVGTIMAANGIDGFDIKR